MRSSHSFWWPGAHRREVERRRNQSRTEFSYWSAHKAKYKARPSLGPRGSAIPGRKVSNVSAACRRDMVRERRRRGKGAVW